MIDTQFPILKMRLDLKWVGFYGFVMCFLFPVIGFFYFL